MWGVDRAVTDAQYLDRLFRKVRGRPIPALLEGYNGNPWMQLLSHLPTDWVKAHLSDAQAVEKGWPFRDVRGNRAADKAANELATAALPAAQVVERRIGQLEALDRVHAIISAVEQRVLEAKRPARMAKAVASTARRKKLMRQRLPRTHVPGGRSKPRAGEVPPPPPPPAEEGQRPPFLHNLCLGN